MVSHSKGFAVAKHSESQETLKAPFTTSFSKPACVFFIFAVLFLLPASAYGDRLSTENSGPRVEFLDMEDAVSEAGHISLKWRSISRETVPATFELQRTAPGVQNRFETVYEGRDTASFRSGLSDGSYLYRVRAKTTSGGNWGPWSASKKLRVTHHPTSTVLLFLVSGAIVFLATLTLILRGALQDSSEGENQ